MSDFDLDLSNVDVVFNSDVAMSEKELRKGLWYPQSDSAKLKLSDDLEELYEYDPSLEDPFTIDRVEVAESSDTSLDFEIVVYTPDMEYGRPSDTNHQQWLYGDKTYKFRVVFKDS